MRSFAGSFSDCFDSKTTGFVQGWIQGPKRIVKSEGCPASTGHSRDENAMTPTGQIMVFLAAFFCFVHLGVGQVGLPDG